MPYFYREHVVYTCLVIEFLSLSRKTWLLCLKWMLITISQILVLFFFCMGDRLRGHGDKAVRNIPSPVVYVCMFIWNSVFSSLGMLSSNKQHDELLILYFWLPILAFPAPSAPNLWLCWMLSVMLQLAAGQLKDKQLLNKSMTLFRTNRAVERV